MFDLTPLIQSVRGSSLECFYCVLAAVFWLCLRSLSSLSAVRACDVRSLWGPPRAFSPLSWDLAVALYFCGFCIPLFRVVCCAFTLLSSFILALATASRMRVLRALSQTVSYASSDASVSFVPEFRYQVRVARSVHPSLFLGSVAFGLRCWSCVRPLAGPVRAFLLLLQLICLRSRLEFVSFSLPSGV